MSVVTGIMLIIGPADWEGPAVAAVQAWLAERGFGPLLDVSEQTGGSKHPQFEAWSAGFNYFPEAEFVEAVMSLRWEGTEHMALILQPEEGSLQIHQP